MIKLGSKVTDSITGFSGIVNARVEYLSGCVQYQVIPKSKKGETKMPTGEWIDEARLVSAAIKKGSGGPQRNNPTGMPNP